jgi:hypothetical protein
MLREVPLRRSPHALSATQSVTFSPDSEFQLSSSGCCCRQPSPSPTLYRQFPTWIHLGLRVHTWSPNVIWSHPSALCLHGLRRPPRRAVFFQRLPFGRESLRAQQPVQQVHARDQDRRRSAEHPSAARRQWRGRRRWSTWPLAAPTSAIPPRRCHDIGEHIMKSVISDGYDIPTYRYQGAKSCHIMTKIMSNIIIFRYHSTFFMIFTWYHRQYHKKIAQETGMILSKLWYHVWYHNYFMISYMISYLFDNIRVAQETGQYDIIHDIIHFFMISYMICYMILA